MDKLTKGFGGLMKDGHVKDRVNEGMDFFKNIESQYRHVSYCSLLSAHRFQEWHADSIRSFAPDEAYHFKAKIGKFGNILNPNHRHDEAHEIATDRKRDSIARSHRFWSFAPER